MEVKHKVQLGILTSLLFEPRLRFTDLNKTKLTNDQFTFHLKRLVRAGLVEKAGECYQLTVSGLEYAGRIGVKSIGLVKQPKVSVMVFVFRPPSPRNLRGYGRIEAAGVKESTGISPWSFKNTNQEILLSERLTDPIIGMISAPVTKVKAEESISRAAIRCLREETGLVGITHFVGVVDYRHFAKDKLVESTMINCFKASDTVGKLKRTTKKVTNGWYLVEELPKMAKVYPGFSEIVRLVLVGEVFFREECFAR